MGSTAFDDIARDEVSLIDARVLGAQLVRARRLPQEEMFLGPERAGRRVSRPWRAASARGMTRASQTRALDDDPASRRMLEPAQAPTPAADKSTSTCDATATSRQTATSHATDYQSFAGSFARPLERRRALSRCRLREKSSRSSSFLSDGERGPCGCVRSRRR